MWWCGGAGRFPCAGKGQLCRVAPCRQSVGYLFIIYAVRGSPRRREWERGEVVQEEGPGRVCWPQSLHASDGCGKSDGAGWGCPRMCEDGEHVHPQAPMRTKCCLQAFSLISCAALQAECILGLFPPPWLQGAVGKMEGPSGQAGAALSLNAFNKLVFR